MTHAALKMSLMRVIYSFFKNFIMIFVNIYLWQTGHSIQAVALFNLFNYLAASVSFHLGNVVALRDGRINYMLSSLSFIALFLIAIWQGDETWRFAAWIGILGGLGDGFFFFNLNTFQASELNKDEMDHFMVWLGIVTKVTAILSPLISGLLTALYGFRAMALMLLVLLIFQFFMALTLPSGRVGSLPRFNFKMMWERPSLRNALLTHVVRAPYNEFTILTNSVFLYVFTQNEAFTGVLNSAFAVASILMFWIYRLFQKKWSRRDLMFSGAVAHTAAIFFLFQPSLLSFILYNLATAIGGAFFGQPLTGVQIHSAKAHSADEAEMLGILQTRVILLTFGRCLFFGAVYLWYTGFESPLYMGLLVCNLAVPLLSYRMIREEV